VIVMTDLPVHRLELLGGHPVTHGFTCRAPALPIDGDVSFATGRHDASVRENRTRWARAVGVDASRLVCARQVHGTEIRIVGTDDAGRGSGSYQDAIEGTDGMLSRVPGLPLAVLCADCVPILLYDPVRHAIGAVHAGWRGTVNNIAGHAVRAMQDHFHSEPRDIVAGIGPSIGPCCYDVGVEVADAWTSLGYDTIGTALRNESGRPQFDLWTANRIALVAAGVPEDRVELSRICTRCHSDRFFSHRAQGTQAGRFAAIIALKR
jgi:polyphenol oxidase